MAVPKRKTSPSRRGNRRAHLALDGINIIMDERSGTERLSHHISKEGYYKGRQVIKHRIKNSDVDSNEAETL